MKWYRKISKFISKLQNKKKLVSGYTGTIFFTLYNIYCSILYEHLKNFRLQQSQVNKKKLCKRGKVEGGTLLFKRKQNFF